MGSSFSHLWNRGNTRRRMSGDGGGSSSSTNGDRNVDNDDDPALAMVLAFMLRSGHMRIMRQRTFDSHCDDDSDTGESSYMVKVNTDHPNTVMESDLCQEVSLNQGFNCKENTALRLKLRETGCCGKLRRSNFTRGNCISISSRCIPNHVEQQVKHGEKLFCGTYSADGNMFLSACQDRHIRVYNTQTKLDKDKPLKDIVARDVGWSVIDTAFSSDSRFAAYSSWSNFVHVCSLFDRDDPHLLQHNSLNLQPEQTNFAVFSLQFSMDGSEILCGANDEHLYIYDIERDQRTLRIDAHEDDINAVCFADSRSQIIYSGGDDGLVKVWDRRTLSNTATTAPVGTLAGHQDGITYIDTKGDARYLLSNSKDQSIKLWDIRCFSSNDAIENVRHAVSEQMWDYRWENVPRTIQRRRRGLRGDTSVMSYTGHRVLNTLIRARFSPLHTTGNKYIYTGCSTGRVVVYDILTGRIVSQIKKHRNCVRDVSWHPYRPQLISSSWDGTFNEWGWKCCEE